MNHRPATISSERQAAQVRLLPRRSSRPGSPLRPHTPRTVRVTLEDVIVALQDCTDDDELVVLVLLRLMERGLLAPLPRFERTLRCAAA